MLDQRDSFSVLSPLRKRLELVFNILSEPIW